MSRQEDIERQVASFLVDYGVTNAEVLKNTPARVAKSWEFLLSGYEREVELQTILTSFEAEGYNQIVLCKNISFFSVCEHHLLPFFGVAHVGYIPTKKVIGASKLARIVDIFARRLQIQERMTRQIALALQENLQPKGVAVVLKGAHMCMRARGVQQTSSELITSEMFGVFFNLPEARAEFLSLVRES